MASSELCVVCASEMQRRTELCSLLRGVRKEGSAGCAGGGRVIIFVASEAAALALKKLLHSKFPCALLAGHHASEALARFWKGARLALIAPDDYLEQHPDADSKVADLEPALVVHYEPPAGMPQLELRARYGARARMSRHLLEMRNKERPNELHRLAPRRQTPAHALDGDYAALLAGLLQQARQDVPPGLLEVCSVAIGSVSFEKFPMLGDGRCDRDFNPGRSSVCLDILIVSILTRVPAAQTRPIACIRQGGPGLARDSPVVSRRRSNDCPRARSTDV